MPPRKMGRPKIENPKSKIITVRLARETVDKLNDCVRIAKETQSEIIRQGIDRMHDEVQEKTKKG